MGCLLSISPTFRAKVFPRARVIHNTLEAYSEADRTGMAVAGTPDIAALHRHQPDHLRQGGRGGGGRLFRDDDDDRFLG
jgi:hypothetical protein